MPMPTLATAYEDRIFIDDGLVHRYRALELADTAVLFLLSLCQEVALHPTPHARVRLNDRPVRRSATPGMYPPRLPHCPTCYAPGMA